MIEIPKVENVPIERLRTDGKNPNQMTEAQKKALMENFRRFGFIVPIITNEDYLIADGEHRLQAAAELGMAEVPVVRLPLKEVDRRMLRQVLNKLRGAHDFFLDKEEFAFINNEGDAEELKRLLALGDADVKAYLDLKEPDMNASMQKDLNSGVNTSNKCPKCGYEW